MNQYFMTGKKKVCKLVAVVGATLLGSFLQTFFTKQHKKKDSKLS